MVRIGHIGDLQLGIYTNNLKNYDWKHSIQNGVWSWNYHSPVTSLRLAVPHRLGNIESYRLHKLIHPEEDRNRLCNSNGVKLGMIGSYVRNQLEKAA